LKPLDSTNVVTDGDDGFDAFVAMESMSDPDTENYLTFFGPKHLSKHLAKYFRYFARYLSSNYLR
jgi:hypothetical protein